MEEELWSEQVARVYDESSADMYAPEILGPTVDFLARRAGGGRALELAIGTGRVALPLNGRGVPVAGIELSEPMVAELRKKPGGTDIPVVIGDMTSTRISGEFRLVYLVFNTIMNVTSQEEQVATFRNAAAHLAPGGHFLVEVGVPGLQRLPPGETVRAFALTPAHLGFDTFDLVNQQLVSHHYWISDGSARTFHSPHRYVWPSELDLMAQLAGLDLRERWGGWQEETFTADSRSHVSVWQKPTLGEDG
jgi:SAM-dependent methyltransferase